MQINFFLKDDKKVKTSIIAIIRYKGNRFKITTGISVEVTYWDKATHRAKLTRLYPNHDTINIRLNQFENAAKKLFTAADISRTIPTLAEIKQQCTPPPSQTPPPPEKSFIDHFRNYIETSQLKPRTRLFYGTTANVLQRYEQATRQKLQFADINITFYNSFRAWVNSTPREQKEDQPPKFYASNTFGTFIKHIKAVMSATGSDGTKQHENADYHHRKFVKETETADSVYLSTEELKQIQDLKISYDVVSLQHPDLIRLHIDRKIKALEQTRSFFLIGCYTALRISDFSRLERYNIGDSYIRIKPKKGIKKNDDVVIPIHPVISGILASGFDLSHKMSDQRFNEHLKELCQLSGICELVTTVRTEGGRQVSRTAEKWTLVSSHTARRSGATNMFISGIPSISIMKITGHRTERSFMRYIRISQEENARLLAQHPFFKS